MVQFSGIRFLAVSVLMVAFSYKALAQHSLPHQQASGDHKITLGIGHAYFAEKESDTKNVVSAYVINYDYVLSKHWSIGSHNDILMENEQSDHGIPSGNSATERPVVAKLLGLYSPFRDGHLMFGVGDEIKKSQNHLILNIGFDYGVHITQGWEIAGEISYDSKVHGPDSWIVGLGISRTLRRHHKG